MSGYPLGGRGYDLVSYDGHGRQFDVTRPGVEGSELYYVVPLAFIGLLVVWLVYKWAGRSWILGLGIENARVILPYTLGRLFRRRHPDFSVPPIEGIQASTRLVETDNGRILVVCFDGRYPPGSFGNEHATRMVELANTTIEKHKPQAVLFDLQHLNYVWGDAICGLAMTIRDNEHKTFLPACVYAEGRTASALSGLFRNGWLFALAGIELFQDRTSAENYLKERLRQGAV